jgi:hypothetical protein
MERLCGPRGAHSVRMATYSDRHLLLMSDLRCFTWIFLLDTAFVIFNNVPPRMVIKEMKMHMAVPEACFQAATADQCYEQIQLFVPDTSLYWKLSFRCAFESLCKENITMNLRHVLAALGPLNLFVLTSGELSFRRVLPRLVWRVC